MIWKKLIVILLCLATIVACTGCTMPQEMPWNTDGQATDRNAPQEDETASVTLDTIPAYSGEPYCVLYDNQPDFDVENLPAESFEIYSDLDGYGRCGVVYANIGQDLMPTEERGSIGQVKPTGWHTVKYDFVDGKYLYNRCHLIGFQLSGENANEKNLITGTRYMNTEGMLPFENMVADFVKETDCHVLYRVTPIFEGSNLVATGVQMEAISVEDKGEGICFNVFVYNIQPGVTIDYATGESWLAEVESPTQTEEPLLEIRGNKSSKIYHMPGQMAYEDMADSKNLVIFHSEEEAIAAGYRKAQR